MKTILILIQKEFIQVFRNKNMLPIIFILPIVQLIVLVYAANLNMKDIRLTVCDNDRTQLSTQLIEKFNAAPFFILSSVLNVPEGKRAISSNQTDILMVIPDNFSKDLHKENQADIQFLFDAVNASKAGISQGYCMQIVRDFNQYIIVEENAVNADMAQFKNIDVGRRFRFNPELDYKIYMSSGILVILITVVSMFLSGLNLVREKEIGTIEQINVTPIKKYQFISAKLLPFLFIALFEMAFGLLVAKILFNLPMLGSLWLLFGITVVYLIAALGLGLLMSVFAARQQQVMFMSFFFLIIFILMSGIFTTTESMPQWGKMLNTINPVYYYMNIVRMILLKGSVFSDVKSDFFALLIYAFSVISIAILSYRKRA